MKVLLYIDDVEKSTLRILTYYYCRYTEALLAFGQGSIDGSYSTYNLKVNEC